MWAPGFGPARLPQRQRRRPGPLSSCVRPLWPLLLFLLATVGPVHAWESGDLELFDLVEEVQLNFYEFLGVQQPGWTVPSAWGCFSLAFCRPSFLHPQKLCRRKKEERCGRYFV
ncbi:Dnajc1 [Phodopus roborovskii]|uniref:Dnajc1 protein n=1 Tax=Phodopus roborovskii TaxID=109678 RepID=A0AAV0A8X4_PHORO|nr:Dnajc1 [Phodopus roborovskii]